MAKNISKAFLSKTERKLLMMRRIGRKDEKKEQNYQIVYFFHQNFQLLIHFSVLKKL